MPTSGSVNGTNVAGSEGSYLDWQLASQDVPNNRSLINWQAGWRFPAHTCRGLRKGSGALNGSYVYWDYDPGDGVHSFNSGHNHTPKLQTASGSAWVNHNSDGTCTLSVYVGMTGWDGGPTLFSQGSNNWALPTIPRTPGAPSTPVASEVKQTSLVLTWSPNPSDALPDTSYTIGYGTSSSAPTSTTIVSSSPATLTGLDPGLTYYFWVKSTNSIGTGPYSSPTTVTLVAGARVKSEGVWYRAVPYIKVAGVWQVAQPWVRSVGVWKETI